MGLTKDIKKYLKKNMDQNRYQHTLNVRRTARKLVRKHLTFNSREEKKKFLKKVSLAALLHDVDKQKDPADLWKKLKGDPKVRQDEIRDSREVWHAFSSAITAKRVFGMEDPDILNALRFHTTGRKGMSSLEKIIYLADYIEPGRSFPGVDKVRRAAKRGIDAGCYEALDQTIAHLNEKGTRVAGYTLEARKDLRKHGTL